MGIKIPKPPLYKFTALYNQKCSNCLYKILEAEPVIMDYSNNSRLCEECGEEIAIAEERKIVEK